MQRLNLLYVSYFSRTRYCIHEPNFIFISAVPTQWLWWRRLRNPCQLGNVFYAYWPKFQPYDAIFTQTGVALINPYQSPFRPCLRNNPGYNKSSTPPKWKFLSSCLKIIPEALRQNSCLISCHISKTYCEGKTSTKIKTLETPIHYISGLGVVDEFDEGMMTMLVLMLDVQVRNMVLGVNVDADITLIN